MTRMLIECGMNSENANEFAAPKNSMRRRFLQSLVAAGAATYVASPLSKLLSIAEALDNSPYESSVAPQSPSVPRVDINYASHPMAIDGKWKNDWKDATLIDVPNLLPKQYATYPYSGKTGYAYARLMHDDETLYGNAEYYPPPNESGIRGFDPYSLYVFLDPTDDKSNLAQPDDYYFNLFPGSGYFKGIYYSQGLGYYGSDSGYSSGTPWKNWLPGFELKDSSIAQHAFSVISTPTFETPHPYYEFKFSKTKLGLKNPFGLGLVVRDSQIVSKSNGGTLYTAYFPANENCCNRALYWHPSVWADAYFAQPKTTTTSTTSRSTETSSISSIIKSTSTTQSSTSSINALQTLLEVLGIGGGVTGISAYGVYRYFKRKSGTEQHQTADQDNTK